MALNPKPSGLFAALMVGWWHPDLGALLPDCGWLQAFALLNLKLPYRAMAMTVPVRSYSACAWHGLLETRLIVFGSRVWGLR